MRQLAGCRRLSTQLARRDDPVLAQCAGGDLALDHLAGRRALVESAVAAHHPLPRERALGHVVSIGLAELAHLVGDLLQCLVEHPLRHRHVWRQLTLPRRFLEQDRLVIVVLKPLPGLRRGEPISIESDRLQHHRIVALDAVDEVHPLAPGVVLAAEPIEPIRVHQSRGMLIRIRAGPLIFHPGNAAICLDAIGPLTRPPLPWVAAPRRPCHTARAGVAVLSRPEALGLLVHLMPGEPCGHGDHGLLRQRLTAQDLPRTPGGHRCPAAAAFGFPVAVALRFLAHPGGRCQVRHLASPPLADPVGSVAPEAAPHTGPRAAVPAAYLSRSARRWSPAWR